MAGKIKAMWTNKDIRNRILFTLFAFLVYRLGSAITVPDVNTTDLVNGLGENSLFAMLNLLGGGGLEQFSVFAFRSYSLYHSFYHYSVIKYGRYSSLNRVE